MRPEDAQNEKMLQEFMQILSNNFDNLCQKRYDKGQEVYGKFTFLGTDVIRMMMEELADTANYCRMQFIKLMLLQSMLEESGILDKATEDDEVQLGFQSFKGTKPEGWH